MDAVAVCITVSGLKQLLNAWCGNFRGVVGIPHVQSEQVCILTEVFSAISCSALSTYFSSNHLLLRALILRLLCPGTLATTIGSHACICF